MTSQEVAELLGVPVSTVREWGRKGTLPRVKLGRHVRYICSHVEAAILHAEEGRAAAPSPGAIVPSAKEALPRVRWVSLDSDNSSGYCHVYGQRSWRDP
jgi:excisionase family DNA binding protein